MAQKIYNVINKYIIIKRGNMRLIEKCAYSSAKFIQVKKKQNHADRAILYFGFQVIYGDIIKIFLLTLLSLILKSFLSTAVLAIAFIVLRTYAGGIHMNTEIKCTIVTIILLLVPGTLIAYLSSYISTRATLMFILFVLVFSFICLYKYAPKDCINRPITDKHTIQKFKRYAIITLFILISFSLVIIKYYDNFLAVSIGSGVILAIFTVIPSGYNLLDLINRV